MALSLALLASAGGLAAALQATAPGPPASAAAVPGTVVAARGVVMPFTVPDSPKWDAVASLLDVVTYRLATPAGDAVVLVTAASPYPIGKAVALQGFLLWQGPHPDDPARTLVLLQGDW